MSEILTNRGHRVSVLSEDVWHQPDRTTVPLTPNRPLSTIAAWVAQKRGIRWGNFPHVGARIARQFAHIHRHLPIDVIQMEESFGWVGQVQSRVQIPVVTRLHGPHFLSAHRLDTKKSEQREAAERWAISNAEAITCPSQTTLDSTRLAYGFSTDLFSVIPNPAPAFSADPAWSLEQCDKWRLLWVGRFDFPKGADVVLKAFVRLHSIFPRLKLSMIGPDVGLQVEDGRVLSFEGYSGEFLPPGVRAQIDFRGLQSPSQISEARIGSFAALMSSRSENFPNVAQEALAAGMPLIATDCGGIAEMVVDGVSGCLVPSASDLALADRTRWALENRDAAAAMAREGWARCQQLYAPNVIGTRTIDFFDRVVERYKLRRRN